MESRLARSQKMRRKRKRAFSAKVKRPVQLTPVQKIDKLNNIPQWLSAFGTIGLLIAAIYGAFFSDLSQALVSQLTKDNDSLRSERNSLDLQLGKQRLELANLEITRENQEKQLSDRNKKLRTLDEEFKEKSLSLEEATKTLVNLDRQISTARIKLSEITKEFESLYIQKRELALERLTGRSRMPEYLIESAFSNRSGSYKDGYDLNYNLDELAFEELMGILNKEVAVAESELQLSLAKQYREDVLTRCPDKKAFENRVMKDLKIYQKPEIPRLDSNSSNYLAVSEKRKLASDEFSKASSLYITSIGNALEYCSGYIQK